MLTRNAAMSVTPLSLANFKSSPSRCLSSDGQAKLDHILPFCRVASPSSITRCSSAHYRFCRGDWLVLQRDPVKRPFNRWLESLIYYGGWGAREATYISIPSAQAWTPSISTDPHISCDNILAVAITLDECVQTQFCIGHHCIAGKGLDKSLQLFVNIELLGVIRSRSVEYLEPYYASADCKPRHKSPLRLTSKHFAYIPCQLH
jgi:hypothetical protein